MREQHLDLLAQSSGCSAFPRLGDPTRHVARALMDRAWHLPHRAIWAAPGLQGASRAVVLGCTIEDRRVVIHASARCSQRLAAGTEVDIALMIKGEVLA